MTRTITKPETCRECERYFDGHCIPVKEKHGHTPVDADQEPPAHCIYEFSKCDKCGAPLVNGNCSVGDH